MSAMKESLFAALERLAELERLITEHKALYAERDALTLQLQKQGFTEAEHEGRTFILTDNFAGETNTVYRVAFARRYEIKIKDKK